MAKYKVGDKVRIVSKRTAEHWNPKMDKWLGRVMTIRSDEIDWHTGEHFGYKMEEDQMDDTRFGWFWWDDMIAGLANPGRSSLIVEIQFDGNTTRATLIKDGREVKTAEARCSPSDTFDRGEGAKVAVNRLFAKKEKPTEKPDLNGHIDNITPSEFCGELPSSPPPAAVLPLVDGTDFEISVETVAELSGLYPAVDVEQQLRNMRGWLLANPKNKKTKAGIMRFVNSWLSREQNSARPASSQATGGRYGKPDIPKGASGELGKAELEAIQRVLAQE